MAPNENDRWRGRFFRRVFTRLGLLLSIGMLVVCLVNWQIMDRWLHGYTSEQLRKSAHLAERLVDRRWPYASAEAMQAECREVRERTGLRMTLIDPQGRVLADSDADPAPMENHAHRPEVAAALAGRTGENQRVSVSVGHPFVYLASPLERNGRVQAVVRLAASAQEIRQREAGLLQWIGLGLAVALLLALVTAWLMARALAEPVQRVSQLAQRLSTGDLQKRVEVHGDDELAQVADSLDRMRENLAARIVEVQQQRRDLEIIVSRLEEGVIAVDRRGCTFMANAAARRMLGFGPILLSGPLADRLQAEALGRLWREAQSRRDPELRREIKLTGPDGVRSVDVAVLHVADSQTPIAWLVCLRDITELARSTAMKADFVANASHELRTPVASIRAAVDTLRQEDLDDATRGGFLAMIDRNVDRLQNLTEDLMHLNRVESADVELSKATFDPQDVFAAMAASFADALERKNARIVCSSRVAEVTTDRRWLDLVLKNIVDNAVKFIGEGGRIDLRCLPEKAAVRFEVVDDGCGIPPEDLHRVFERFYQVDRSRSLNAGGTGLGLAIVKHAVHVLGGEVSLDSELGRGTAVTFTIPGRRVEKEAPLDRCEPLVAAAG